MPDCIAKVTWTHTTCVCGEKMTILLKLWLQQYIIFIHALFIYLFVVWSFVYSDYLSSFCLIPDYQLFWKENVCTICLISIQHNETLLEGDSYICLVKYLTLKPDGKRALSIKTGMICTLWISKYSDLVSLKRTYNRREAKCRRNP